VEPARTQGSFEARNGPDARVQALLARHGTTLMRVARQASLCEDDAMDALQRALEIYVRRLDTVERATEVAWLKVVVRHESYAIRKARSDCVGDPDLDAFVAAPDRSVEEQVLSGDRVTRSAEALRALKPDEARALMLKAHGLSYDEIARRCGWTYTKVNRCITEGRRRFMEVYAELESGDACERFAPALRALATGTASSAQMVELRPHLRGCSACRATVRDLHLSTLRRVKLLAPIPGIGWLWGRLTGTSTASGSSPAPAPARAPTPPPGPNRLHALTRVKQDATQLMHRTGSADVSTGIQIAASSGSGRVAALGAIAGLCLSGVGAGTVCVVRGVIDPLDLFHVRPHATPVHHARPAATPPPSPPRAAATPVATVAPIALRPTATPVATRTPHPPARRSRSHDPSQGHTATSQEHAPISPTGTTTEFAAAPAAGTGTTAAAAPAPPTGGGEFTP
jgi:RNA polymerase sigma factor (sigma-70 family)